MSIYLDKIKTTFAHVKVVFTFRTEVSLKGIRMQFMVLYFSDTKQFGKLG